MEAGQNGGKSDLKLPDRLLMRIHELLVSGDEVP